MQEGVMVAGNFGWGIFDQKYKVPGWFGAEDQGAGVALGSINANSRPDMVVFHIDNPAGENRAYYRVGWDLSVSGSATGWSEIKPVPGWFGAENQGGGITLADINRNGRPDLVTFHIDNPAGENRGYYRIGWDLDTSGNAAGGWSNIKSVPGWFGAENQGGDVASLDVDRNGLMDLVVFHIDNPAGENRGYYRIGWNLDSAGNAAGWSDVKAIPGWFGAENQGAGIAAFTRFGENALVVTHMDNPAGANQLWHRVSAIDRAGNSIAGWSDPKPLLPPGGVGWETQDIGVATGYVSGRSTPDLLTFFIDNPPGENSGWTFLSEYLLGVP
ncbi:hypothetical protein [Roseicella aerolata]|uniref:VCBS repeat-containing protein n=1 Tax=Roseicella aerolata TaxID=2883479 RepID=A0A9X1IBT2_9PROT|nr:hypothetical protein [Roseicella aerolata]MCB4821492.1 hypothetical protein [Roseicella aerolata]